MTERVNGYLTMIRTHSGFLAAVEHFIALGQVFLPVNSISKQKLMKLNSRSWKDVSRVSQRENESIFNPNRVCLDPPLSTACGIHSRLQMWQ